MNQSAMVTVPCQVTVAAGVFAPGHLGELTRYLPFELVDDVLDMTGAVQKRMRALPSRVGMYFVLAMTLFPGIGYLKVWDKMTGALEDLGLPRPSEKALRDLRRGSARPRRRRCSRRSRSRWRRRGPGDAWRGLRTVAFDGLNSVHVPDSDRNRSWLGKLRNRLGLGGCFRAVRSPSRFHRLSNRDYAKICRFAIAECRTIAYLPLMSQEPQNNMLKSD